MFALRFSLVIAVLMFAVNNIAADKYKTVETFDGEVRGIRKTTFLNGIPFYSFKGIPYAKPPIGDLRFKAPEPIESWKPAVLDAFEHGNACFQPRKSLANHLPQTNVKANEKLAVLFFIHGGAYTKGASNDDFYGPDFIVEKQTILVTINYRLGLFGFLSLDMSEYSGNMGLKDQQLALKWINLNIDRFGGDNKRITICGQSAGGVSVHFHILSTESKKLFRNAILMSGVIGAYWAMSENNHHLEIVRKIAIDLNEPKETYEELLTFLKSAPADKLKEYSTIKAPNGIAIFSFAPVVERKDAKQPFLIESPEKVYKTHSFDIDVFFTMTSAEFLMLLSLVPPLKDISNDFNLLLPFKGLQLPVGSDNYRNLTSEIFKFYFGDNAIDKRSLKQYVAMLSDLNVGYEVDKTVKIHATRSDGKTFYARFSVDSKLNVLKRRDPSIEDLPGASHSDDLFYLFKHNMFQSFYDEVVENRSGEHSKICLQVIDNMTKIFTNFAKYSEISYQDDPINGFQPVKDSFIHFLDIRNDGLKTGRSPNKESFDFLASIEEKAYKLSDDLIKRKRDEL
ncbi:esterase B1-like isoform X2 [Contarinia nasturtii]|uniref:esterase B1-like isoform X2 n=1 Tax=Contarinia nasturtii TaxID=265458 RepID=UPI0012D46EF6|nr:esterase B1-like isoform X2 [Contarinia nasturtii]